MELILLVFLVAIYVYGSYAGLKALQNKHIARKNKPFLLYATVWYPFATLFLIPLLKKTKRAAYRR